MANEDDVEMRARVNGREDQQGRLAPCFLTVWHLSDMAAKCRSLLYVSEGDCGTESPASLKGEGKWPMVSNCLSGTQTIRGKTPAD